MFSVSGLSQRHWGDWGRAGGLEAGMEGGGSRGRRRMTKTLPKSQEPPQLSSATGIHIGSPEM